MSEPTDEQRLNWLVDHGAYSLVDSDEYFGLTMNERRAECRRRIDAYISKGPERDQEPMGECPLCRLHWLVCNCDDEGGLPSGG